MTETKTGYQLSSGREFYANGGLVSIATNGDGTFRIREGYDGYLSGATGDELVYYDAPVPGERDPNWTAEERRELADFMIAQWTAFKRSASDATPDKPVKTVWKVEITEGVFQMFSSEKDAQEYASLNKSARMERLLATDYNASTQALKQPIDPGLTTKADT